MSAMEGAAFRIHNWGSAARKVGSGGIVKHADDVVLGIEGAKGDRRPAAWRVCGASRKRLPRQRWILKERGGAVG
jgi:hypothetical protein